MSLGNLSGVALITGAASGIGREVAISFAQCGAKLILIDLNRNSLQETAELCMTDPKWIKIFDIDITNDDKVINLIQSIPDMHDFGGRLDYAINCAGIGGREFREPFSESIMEYDDLVMNINLRAQGICNKEEIKLMLKQEPLCGNFNEGRTKVRRPRGCIVNISSYAGLNGAPIGWMYCASKHGGMNCVVGMTKSAAVTHACDNIRVNAVAPGLVNTKMWQDKEEIIQNLAKATVAGRPAEPFEVADTILFLCSDRATYINGETICVDGGTNAS